MRKIENSVVIDEISQIILNRKRDLIQVRNWWTNLHLQIISKDYEKKNWSHSEEFPTCNDDQPELRFLETEQKKSQRRRKAVTIWGPRVDAVVSAKRVRRKWEIKV
jgi:hypothetical protein